MTDFFRNMIKDIGDDATFMADDELHSSEFSGTIDTGSYIFNAELSGSIYGGVPDNKIIALAGESSVGKTFFALGIVKKFLDDYQNAAVFYYDTEAAVTKKMMKERGIDTSRVIIVEKSTIEEFRTHASKLLDNYIKDTSKTKPKMMIILDSLGQLSTEKEITDILKGKNVSDMTRTKMIRGAFRALSLQLARAGCPMIITNHVYEKIGAYVPTKEMSGGGGLRYAASQIVFLSKEKDRDGKDVIGNIIHCKMDKSRFTKENKTVDVRLSYDSGLDRYYGLLDLGVKYGVIQKVGNKYGFPDGRKAFEKAIYKVPEDYFTKDVLDGLESAAKAEFCYGQKDRYLEDFEPEEDDDNEQDV